MPSTLRHVRAPGAIGTVRTSDRDSGSRVSPAVEFVRLAIPTPVAQNEVPVAFENDGVPDEPPAQSDW